MSNLLVNGDIEGGLAKDVRWWTPDGGPNDQEFDNITVSEGWIGWWGEGWPDAGNPPHPLRRPEMTVINRLTFSDQSRIRSGNKAFKAHTFHGAHDMGLMQSLSIQQAGRYRLSAYMHSLYTDCSGNWHASEPYEDDCSTRATWAHDYLSLGIDPMGALEPFNARVVWAPQAEVYGAYDEHPLMLELDLERGWVTLFVRSKTSHALRHQDLYVDDVSLEYIGGEPEPEPRQWIQYRVLLPQDATLAETQAAVERFYPERRTIGFSADDAAARPAGVTHLTVHALHANRWPEGIPALVQFYADFYPGIDELIIEEDEDDAEPPASELLWQCDPRWRDEKIADPDCSLTLCQTGCFVTCLAMAQRFFGIDDRATPSSVNQALGPSGFAGCHVAWGSDYFNRATGLKLARTWDANTVRQHLDAGNMAMAEIYPHSYDHFVLVTRYEGNRFWMLDPYKNVEGWLDAHYTGVENWRLVSRVEDAPEPEPEPPDPVAVRIGPHLQQMTGGWNTYVRAAKPGMVKLVGGFENCWNIWALSPETNVVCRHFTNDYGAVFGADTPRRGAEIWWGYFSDSIEAIARQIVTPGRYIWVEGPNEIYGTHTWEIDRWVEIEMAFCDIIAETGLPIRPVVFCAAVGNPHESEFHKLVPLARKAVQVGGRFGYHAYWCPGCLESDWKWLAGRWQEMDKVFAAHGVTGLKWLMGEGGLVGGHPNPGGGYTLLPKDGWKSPTGYGGDFNRYLADLVEFNERLRPNACCTLFTTGGEGWGWGPFEIGSSEWSQIAARLAP